MRPAKTTASLGSEPEARISKNADDTAVWSLKHIQILWSWAARPAPVPYPPISSIPHTSAQRLSEPDVAPTPFPSEPILAKSFHQNAPVKPKTVLYLAYGSNMCAETFLGMRGIRPLSQVNVAAPSLDLTFDLPGIPYREPCFANTAMRKIPGKKPPIDPPKFPPGMPDRPPVNPPVAQDEDEDKENSLDRRSPVWDKGLYGVVYEVTTEDYAKIVATEGGGASYHEILVPCLVLPPSIRVPEKPTIPAPPMPFLAHTLYAPRLPDLPDGGDDDSNKPSPSPNPNSDDDDGTKPSPPRPTPSVPSWLAPLLRPVRRPQPDYAQPSARYLKLLRDGAREHELPAAYQSYLAALQPYTVTTRGQKLGQVLFLGFWAPVVILMMGGGRLFADKRGRSPAWMVAFSTAVFNLVWLSYDCVGKRVFGDGERTMDGEGNKESGSARGRRGSFASGLRGVGRTMPPHLKVI
ncbi:hypothetical protein NEMBOFW57_002774 [Staphylotrichum longicolle]|uniref:gamma-glutamylcyclotransferase n=1 Tax=Staphylotrichum longicolle TaxID=669026 RepID=A0AAD4F4Q8_9PEZI|nr:hypothetical protein NEMBOFW57_002774 [Staphylotrichum longicolle]